MVKEKSIALERVLASMHLRKPQQEALEAFHHVLNDSEMSLKDMSFEEVSNLFKAKYPTWDYNHLSPEFTFHLATGVGKTRLIGALIAYLSLSGESKDFMIISPRSEIIRKFIHVCTCEDEHYLFVSPSLVDYPTVFTANHSVGDYIQPHFFEGGPRIWILSPQTFTANNARLKQKSENDPCSAVDYLASLDDLVVFFDESHHLGLDNEDDSVWRTELNALKPKMIIGTTASVEEGQNNIIYSYDLKTCLNEHKYTKFVKMIPDKKPDTISDEDYDHMALRFALRRLALKQNSLDDYCKVNELNTHVKAAMLVACVDIKHAEATTKWLQEYLQDRQAVLLVHSQLNESEFVPRLKSVEDSNSPIKVVVNVGMLNEGWDVSNIYIITPLRTMASTTLVTQIMGRGLRLPFGAQVGDDEVDTLDVLCFGRETLQEIITTLTQKGFGTGENSGITVDPSENAAHPEEEFIPKKRINLEVVSETKELRIPLVKMNKEPLPLDLVSIPALKAHEVSYFLINDPKTVRRLGDSMEFDRGEFVTMVTSEVLKQCTYLNYSRHFGKIKCMTDKFLNTSKFTENTIKLDPARVITHIVDCLDKLNKQQKVSYSLKGDELVIDLSSIQITVPENYEYPSDNSMPNQTWNNRTHKGIPFGGWKRCMYAAVPFDNRYEYHVAHVIDTAEDVKEWFRNLPGILTLETPVGKYSPDFAIFLNLGDKNVLLELKDDDRFGREDQDATIKAKAARAWCAAQTEATGKPWEYWLLLTTDSVFCQTIDDIRDSSDIG